jgi:hypothetical protein
MHLELQQTADINSIWISRRNMMALIEIIVTSWAVGIIIIIITATHSFFLLINLLQSTLTPEKFLPLDEAKLQDAVLS